MDRHGEVWVAAFDPGDVHVGVAIVDAKTQETILAVEMTPRFAVEWLKEKLIQGALEEVVIEKFVLYPWMATEQSWSEMETSQLIGVLRYVCREYGMEPVMQGADIKKAAVKILRAKGKKSLAKIEKAGGHAFDAETHGMYRVLREYEPGSGRRKQET